MSKKLKSNFISSILCVIIGVSIFIYTIFNINNINEQLLSYLQGFSVGMGGVAIYFIYRNIKAKNNPKYAEQIEIIEKDERIKLILNSSMANTFKITIVIEALISLISAFTGHMEVSRTLGGVIWLQGFVYLISYVIISKKN